jgi:RimJ/RimL family protein N-acetyltransferase
MTGARTQRLALRPLCEADRALFVALHADAQVMEHIGPTLSAAEAGKVFDGVLRRSTRAELALPAFAIVSLATGTSVGVGGVAAFDRASRSAEVGMILAPGAQSCGFGSIVLPALVDVAFADLPAAEVWVQYRDGHSAAAALSVRSGLTPRNDRRHRSRDAWVCVATTDRASWVSSTVRTPAKEIARCPI